MGKACFQPAYEEAVAIVGRRIAERREEMDESSMDAGSVRRALGIIPGAFKRPGAKERRIRTAEALGVCA